MSFTSIFHKENRKQKLQILYSNVGFIIVVIISLFIPLQIATAGAKSLWGKIQCLPQFIPSRSQMTHMKSWRDQWWNRQKKKCLFCLIKYIRGAFNKFPDIFVQAFKIVVDSWKFSMLLLYILWDDWPIFMISAFYDYSTNWNTPY